MNDIVDTKIKICGLTCYEDINIVNELLPEYIGFVFWERSKRNVTRELAKNLKNRLDSRIDSVGVFVDAEIDFITTLVSDRIIDVVQLHGSENEDYISALRDKINAVKSDGAEKEVPIIKAFNINRIESFEEVTESSADHIMIDSGKGTGITYDWSKLETLNRPYFLAGGLSPDNVSEAVKKLHPYAVDVSSGVETDGHKDALKIKKFIDSVRLMNNGRQN